MRWPERVQTHALTPAGDIAAPSPTARKCHQSSFYRGSGRTVIVTASASTHKNTRRASETRDSRTEFTNKMPVAATPDQPNHRGGSPRSIEDDADSQNEHDQRGPDHITEASLQQPQRLGYLRITRQ